MHIGKRIRKLRKTAHLTASQLAASAGLSQSYISEIERGVKQPPVATLEKICGALGVSLSELLGAGEDVFPVPEHVRPLLEASKKLSPSQIELIAQFIRSLK